MKHQHIHIEGLIDFENTTLTLELSFDRRLNWLEQERQEKEEQEEEVEEESSDRCE